MRAWPPPRSASSVTRATTFRGRFVTRPPLPDNLPRWAALGVDEMSRGERRTAARRLTRDAAGVPHPPHDERVENAQRTGARGIPLPDDAPGSALFRSFDAWATRVTRDEIFAAVPRGTRLVSIDSLRGRGSGG